VEVNSNLLLTGREGRTAEYWPEVVAERIERSEVRTKTTEGQYSPVRLELARLVSSLLYGTQAMVVLNCRLSKAKNTQLMTVSTETVRKAKSRPGKDQSERSDLPCHIIMQDIYRAAKRRGKSITFTDTEVNNCAGCSEVNSAG